MKPAQMPAWWASRPLREKLMMIGGVTLALLALGDALITSPLEKKLRRSSGEVSAMRAKLDTLRKAESGVDAHAPSLREQEAALRTRLQAAQKQQLALQQRVAEAARLPETLRAVVATEGRAHLDAALRSQAPGAEILRTEASLEDVFVTLTMNEAAK